MSTVDIRERGPPPKLIEENKKGLHGSQKKKG